MRTFQLNLFAGFSIVILVAVGTISLFVMQGAEQEMETYAERTEQLYLTRMEHWLHGYYTRGGSWDGVHYYIEEMGVLSGQRVILTDPDGVVIADSHDGLVGRYFMPEWPQRELISDQNNVQLGTLYVEGEPTVETAYQQELARSINFFLFWGSMLALAAALILSTVISRRISAPVRVLLNATRRIGRGDFSDNVQLRDKGEFGELAQAFNGMARDLEHAAQLRRNFVADTAHELRTPLSNIRGYLEAAEDGLVSSGEAVAAVKEDAGLLHRLVEDLHELALADAGGLTLLRRPADMTALVSQAIATADRAAKAKGVELAIQVPAEELPEVQVDSQRIAQVLRNLIDNALTHSERGDKVTLSVELEPDRMLVTVADSGTGVPEQDMSRIFDRFYRVDRSRARATGGSGLGLTICRYLVEAHGGTISAAARAEGGSRFTFTVPLGRATDGSESDTDPAARYQARR
ncbi:MAG: HAMP domain-containing protein [Spirochaetaceae bacterium]|nr:MAG: HAMP domain-containing protein [Spirochaetaceae bacterium]